MPDAAPTLELSPRIAADAVLRTRCPHAPVSDLYREGHKQDRAFELPVGDSPKQRHRIRFWRSAEVDANGEPLWLGASTSSERVEISWTTGGGAPYFTHGTHGRLAVGLIKIR